MLHTKPIFVTLRWMRMVGDVIFLSGVAALVWFALGLVRRPSPQLETAGVAPASP